MQFASRWGQEKKNHERHEKHERDGQVVRLRRVRLDGGTGMGALVEDTLVVEWKMKRIVDINGIHEVQRLNSGDLVSLKV